MTVRTPLALLCAGLMLTGCGASSPRTNPRPQPAPSTKPAAEETASPTAERQQWLNAFARGYFPGRSGQVFVVPRNGDIITSRDALYRFMHGSPWDYDTHIPMLFHGAPFIAQGEWRERTSQQDVVPTLAALIGATPAPTMVGRPLRQALSPGSARPRVVALVVFDGMRADYFDTYAEAMPTLMRMRREGAWFADARATSLPTVTSVGHATIGTGTDPQFHGLSSNTIFNRVTGRPQEAYQDLDPRELMALTLGDIWNVATDGRAVIVGQGGAIRATAGLVGRGSCLVGARQVIAASYNARDAGWETNPTCYRMSEGLKAIDGKRYWEEANGTWMGHNIASPTLFRASSLFQRFEGDALVKVIEQEPFGTDDVTDLLMVNMKGPDYTGHAYGPDSAEIRETLSELDRQMTRVLAALTAKAGANRVVVAITADHGMPGEPQTGRRHYGDEVVALVHKRFDPEGKLVLSYGNDSANSQLYLDTTRLATLGFSTRDVAAYLQSLEFMAAAFTEDEVKAAQAASRPQIRR